MVIQSVCLGLIVVMFVFISTSSANLSTGLVAYYPFNGNANDESGNGHNGTVYGAVLTSDRFGNPGSAYSFDGINDNINIGNGVKPPFPLTVSAWIKTNSLSGFIFRNDFYSNSGCCYDGVLVFITGGKVGAMYGDGGHATTSSRREKYTNNIVITIGTWHLITVRFNAHLDIDIWVDGAPEKSDWGNGEGDTMHYSENSGAIGYMYNSWWFNGSVDDVRVYDYALCDIDIQQLFDDNRECGNNLWNIRHNADDRFHSNEAWLRPWRYNYEDGWGRWVGGYSYDLQWYDGPYTQSSGDLGGFSWTHGCGSLQINGSQDHQWHAWTYVYVDAPTSLTIPASGDCVPTIFVNEDFDNPINFPGQINLTSGWNRVDIAGYNQNDGYIFKLNYDLADNVKIMNSSVILPLRISGASPVYFSRLQDAYDAAGDNDTIQLQDSLFSENLSIDDNKTIIIEGGYDCGYSTNDGITQINDNLIISNGTIIIESGTIEVL